ncbi:MAG: pilus assembly protein N-terminal domain-containing protein [Candidatus Sericytochromatia bacterium]|nr:pilus assembly protein N-terminal domain-containing protein [Candidatus Sericytochromatia bacterium]
MSRRHLVFLLALVAALGPWPSRWPGGAPPAWASVADLTVRQGHTTVFRVPRGATRVAIGDSAVAAVTLIQDGTGENLLIEGRKPGLTNFLVWTAASRQPSNYRLEVLSGRRTETVVIRVQVWELLNGNDSQTGIRWSEGLAFQEAPPTAPFALGLPVRAGVLEARLQALAQAKRAQLEASPTLLALSGQESKFLSGGELPVVVQTPNTVAVDWKPFGVGLKVTPVVEGEEILLRIKPEVSSIDRLNGVQTGNFNIPAIATRMAETQVAVRPGQEIVLAGLKRRTLRTVVSRVPLLGWVPLLGAFFTSTQQEEEEGELVFLVTPTLFKEGEAMPEKGHGKAR